MRFSLQDVADYIRNSRAPKALLAILNLRRPIISFEREAANRPPRYLAVVNEYRRGTPILDIQAKFGCSKTTILRYARMAQIDKRQRGFDPKVRQGVISAYKSGKPIAEISALFGVSQAYVSKTASEEGINRRKPAR